MAQVKISDLTALTGATGTDDILVTHDNSGTLESKKIALSVVKEFIGGKVLTGTLAAGNTSLTISDAAIETTSLLDIYTDVYGVNPLTISVATGSVTMTFDVQQSALNVKVIVK